MNELNWVNILGQIFGVLALIFTCYRYFKRKKTEIMKLSIVAYVCYIIHYFLIGALAGSYTLILAIFRDLYIYLRERHHKKHRHRKLYNNALVFVLLFGAYLVLFFLNLNTPTNILPLGAGLVYLFYEWFTTNKTTLKIGGFVTTLPWLAYDIMSFSIPAATSDALQLIASVSGIIKDKKRRRK